MLDRKIQKTLGSLSDTKAPADKKVEMRIVRILVVDDFVPWQRLVLTQLESQTNYEVISVAVNGSQAVQKARQSQPDVILMDLNLPQITGLEAIRQIRMFAPFSKVLFMSANGDPELIQAAFAAGGAGYILKNDSNTDLIPGIRAVLAGRRFVSRSLAERSSGSSMQDSGDLTQDSPSNKADAS